MDATAVAALAVLFEIVASAHDYAPGVYRGGFGAVALLTAVLLVALTHPAGAMGRLLATRPVLWIGRRSYSLYLWHWPVLALTRPGIDVFWPKSLLIPLQLAAALVLAGLSYRYVEQPFRTGARLPALPVGRLRPTLAGAVVANVVLVGWGGVTPNGGHGLRPPLAAASPVAIGPAATRPPRPPAPSHHAAHRPVRPRPAPRPRRVIAYGDSVMAGARDALATRLGPRFPWTPARAGRPASSSRWSRGCAGRVGSPTP